jgi:hypothetical protein
VEVMGLELLNLANDLRRDYGVVAFMSLESNGLYCKVISSSSVYLISNKDEILKLARQEQFYEEMINRLSSWNIVVKSIDMCLCSGSIGEFDLLMVCGKISELLMLGDVYLKSGKIIALGKQFNSRDALVKELPELIKNSREKFSVQSDLINKLIKLSTDVIYVQNKKAVVLDEIAYVADCMETLNRKSDEYPMEGYVIKSGIKWTKVDKNRFKKVKTNHGEILMIDFLAEKGEVSVLRNIRPWERRKVGESPYPIAILEDGSYSYYYKKI